MCKKCKKTCSQKYEVLFCRKFEDRDPGTITKKDKKKAS